MLVDEMYGKSSKTTKVLKDVTSAASTLTQ
jgi:hypothetical protein